MQDTYNEIKEEEGLVAAKQFISTHGRHFNIVVNGSCNRDIAIHGCFKHLRCIHDGGCSHLTITGRPDELESIEKSMARRKVELSKPLKDNLDEISRNRLNHESGAEKF